MLSFDQRAAEWDAEPRRQAMAQAVAKAIQSRVPLRPDWSALEYGCGTGLVGFQLQPLLGRLMMADSSAGMLQVAQSKIDRSGVTNVELMQLDLAIDPLPAVQYDLLFTSMTLHHLENTLQILSQFFRLLKTDGYLCIADLDTEDGSFHGEDFSGHHGFDRNRLRQQVLRTGFHQCAVYDAYQTSKMTAQGIKEFSLFLLAAQK